jgi:hypothetical protein
VSCGLPARADKLVAGVIGSDASVRRFRDRLPGGGAKWEVLGPDASLDDQCEYKTLKRLHEDSLSDCYEAAWYFHTKGITHATSPTSAWRRYLEHFLLDGWEVGLQSLGEGWDTYGVEWIRRPADRRYLIFAGNFWLARADYLRCLSPLVYLDRYSCEDWIGCGNARSRCMHQSRVNLYEAVYSEENYC